MKKKVSIVTFIPDDYHGHPMVNSITPPDELKIPDSDSVFQAWSNAGYNSYQMGGDPDDPNSEVELFNDYGDSPIYYSAYLIIHSYENDKILSHELSICISDILQDLDHSTQALTIEDLCEECSKLPEIHSMIPLNV